MWLRAEDGTLVNLMQMSQVRYRYPPGVVEALSDAGKRKIPLYSGTDEDCQAVLNAIDKQLAAHNLNLLADTDEKATFGG